MASIADELVFGLMLGIDTMSVRTALDNMCELLSQDARCRVIPHVLPSPIELATELADAVTPVAWISPTLLLLVPELETTVPLLASVRQGVAAFHSVLFTDASSPIRTVDDLSGARVAWVHPTSASGYLVPRLALARRGLDVTSLFSEEGFCKSHGGVVEAVLEGRADVGATYAHFEDGDAEKPLLRAGYTRADADIRPNIVSVSGPIPSDMIVAHPSLPISKRVALAGALCRLASDPVGQQVLSTVVGAEDFAPVSVAALEELQALMQASRTLSQGRPGR